MLFQVHLPFLIVRYTHKYMDLCFSNVVDKLRKNDAETLDDDVVALQPSVSIVNYVYDVRIWIYDPPKHTRPLHFKFSSNESIVATFYKRKQDSSWMKLRGGILARDIKIRTSRDSPNRSPINFDGNGFQKISSHFHHWKCLFSDQKFSLESI